MNYYLLNVLEIENNFCNCLFRLFVFLGHIVNFIKILVPVIIILMGSIDLIKAVIAQKDDEMKKAQSIFIKRLIYGIVLFFVVAAVQFLIGLVGGDTNNRCFKCVADVNGSDCDKDNIPFCREETTINNENSNTENNTQNEEPETVPNPDTPELTPQQDEWDCSNVPIDSSSNCKVKFGGSMYISKSSFFSSDSGNDTLYPGIYNDFETFIPNAHRTSLDTIIINHNTKLIIYEKENFEGNIIFNDKGPMIIYNRRRGSIFPSKDTETEELIKNEGFIEKVSTWDMFLGEEVPPYDYTTPGSFKICCKK